MILGVHKNWQQQVLQEHGVAMIPHLWDEDKEREERTGEKQRLQGNMDTKE